MYLVIELPPAGAAHPSAIGFPPNQIHILAALAALGDAVDAIESRFCCTGDVSLASPLSVNGAVFPTRRVDQDGQVARLRAIAEPSPFGRGNETVVDPNVRKAVQIKQGALDLNGWTLPGAAPHASTLRLSGSARPSGVATTPALPFTQIGRTIARALRR